ncbi:PIN domain-containing protein [Chryseolinea sp. H1M3-3]|uniref:PIN domain-containing protein n=1 Tax=Chryseolinea sp. H1M3-3 TaxID=3034144 RepID=UPI0023ED06A8|nr:PIN domain-containing protein [Chryseolinea sp. H1M3-3]
MSGKNYLLDTNIVIGLFANESSIIEKIKTQPSSIFIPSIFLGELFYGAEQSTMKSQLKAKGTPIPENDIWIGALAHQHGLTLVTRDKHFNSIETLQIENW